MRNINYGRMHIAETSDTSLNSDSDGEKEKERVKKVKKVSGITVDCRYITVDNRLITVVYQLVGVFIDFCCCKCTERVQTNINCNHEGNLIKSITVCSHECFPLQESKAAAPKKEKKEKAAAKGEEGGEKKDKRKSGAKVVHPKALRLANLKKVYGSGCGEYR